MACDPDEVVDEPIEKAMSKLVEIAANRDQLRLRVDTLRARKLEMDLRLRELQDIPDGKTMQAWCADLTENLSGEVATAEIPGEPQAVIVRPGYQGRAVFSGARDGVLHNRAGMTPEQAFFNAAILPGWQKFMPTYRVGTLTAVDEENDTGSVTLDEAESTAQALPVNQSTTLTGVPIEYMFCNAVAFEAGDRVLVQFEEQQWSSPKIVGFESNPRECQSLLAVIRVHLYYGTPNVQHDATFNYIGDVECYTEEPPEGDFVRAEISWSEVEAGLAPMRTWATTDPEVQQTILDAETTGEIDLNSMTLFSNAAPVFIQLLGPSGVLPRVSSPWYGRPTFSAEPPPNDTYPCGSYGFSWFYHPFVKPDSWQHAGEIDDGVSTHIGVISQSTTFGSYRTGSSAGARISLDAAAYNTLVCEIDPSWLPQTLSLDGGFWEPDRAERWVFGDLGPEMTQAAQIPGGYQGYYRAYLGGCYLVYRYKRRS